MSGESCSSFLLGEQLVTSSVDFPVKQPDATAEDPGPFINFFIYLKEFIFALCVLSLSNYFFYFLEELVCYIYANSSLPDSGFISWSMDFCVWCDLDYSYWLSEWFLWLNRFLMWILRNMWSIKDFEWVCLISILFIN